jgi:hypothetical protein
VDIAYKMEGLPSHKQVFVILLTAYFGPGRPSSDDS